MFTFDLFGKSILGTMASLFMGLGGCLTTGCQSTNAAEHGRQMNVLALGRFKGEIEGRTTGVGLEVYTEDTAGLRVPGLFAFEGTVDFSKMTDEERAFLRDLIGVTPEGGGADDG